MGGRGRGSSSDDPAIDPAGWGMRASILPASGSSDSHSPFPLKPPPGGPALPPPTTAHLVPIRSQSCLPVYPADTCVRVLRFLQGFSDGNGVSLLLLLLLH